MQWFRLLPFGPSMNTRSFLQDSDPRAKLIFAATYLYLVTCSNDLVRMVFYATAGFLLVFAARLPLAFLWNGLKGLLPLLLALFLYHLLLGDVNNAVILPCKLVIFIITAIVLSATTPPTKLADGLEAIMRPLTLIRFPVQNFVFMISVAFRFIPLFIDETDSMLKSQKVKHARYKSGSFRIKMQSLLQLLVALFVASLRRADQMALAMDARCYLPGNKIRASRLHFSWRDWMIIISALVLLLIHILLKGAAFER
ncbi:energy-coupling factor transporter transmembrane protein EcfT [Paenibacillus sp. J2TS4]|uniref:energy-coupling factor transporter transmembrane component T family protein n=1 Tax=Paenibacillus sp. J2TS4 TaxID=2807194 RepID=UPI001B1FDF9E|nr:energy-coupling factor transporter transmembrane component T [Paenibacillus sp. J2TS4]GIP36088.1 energy-coupling factor transporter transmembrane protein EcfT [Paenibacillus sp. J2TS4]